MPKYRMPSRCPVCDGEMTITRLRCPQCSTVVEGSFVMDKFSRLSPEQLQFVETFLKVRGNIKEMERELGISYPTVRARLDAILAALGGPGNVRSLTACMTRLRLEVNDPAAVDDAALRAFGAAGVVRSGSSVQVVMGARAGDIEQALQAELAKAAGQGGAGQTAGRQEPCR